jgi:hypothetical protein
MSTLGNINSGAADKTMGRMSKIVVNYATLESLNTIIKQKNFNNG